jgi:hypothetical protein
MASASGIVPQSGGVALHEALMDTEVAHAITHLQAARAHAAAAGQTLDPAADAFLDACEGTAPAVAAIVAAAGGKKPRKKKPARDPTKPKRPLSGYQLFMENIRDTLEAKGAGAMTECGLKWKALGDAGQKPWNDKAKPGQEKGKAVEARWKAMSPDDRLIHFPPDAPVPKTEPGLKKKRDKSDAGLPASEKKKKKKKKKDRESSI